MDELESELFLGRGLLPDSEDAVFSALVLVRREQASGGRSAIRVALKLATCSKQQPSIPVIIDLNK